MLSAAAGAFEAGVELDIANYDIKNDGSESGLRFSTELLWPLQYGTLLGGEIGYGSAGEWREYDFAFVCGFRFFDTLDLKATAGYGGTLYGGTPSISASGSVVGAEIVYNLRFSNTVGKSLNGMTFGAFYKVSDHSGDVDVKVTRTGVSIGMLF
ncbi:hypothetical protein ACXWTF_13190 [Thiomicrolovo sp. ZZH C-3]